MRSDADWLSDIIEAVDNAKRYAQQGRAAFDSDELVRAWMVQQIQIIGEAASRLSSDLLAAHSQVPWREIIDMRNLLVHGYFHLDPDIVWRVVEADLPELERQAREILDGLPPST
ncbi:MAG: HepT-like ribonuclease domain-containing protein [Acidimicrobiia bacterium]